MEEETIQDYPAPLQIRKLDPNTSNEAAEPRPTFQNFLRACYPFQSTTTPSPTTVTLELNAGDVILVHSVHTNGWADGTLLGTGARGWLPTNYCEAYDYGTMRPLLKALTEFWDIIRSDDETNAVLFHNHDYMRGIVAGVRFLLEKSDCLTRDSDWVKDFDQIRRIRKALLADLSNLVKAAKHMQQVALNNGAIVEIANILDDMLFKAFKVVTRAVSFFDIWSDQVASSREPDRRLRGQPSHSVSTNEIETHDTLRNSTNTRQSISSSRRLTMTHRMSYTGRKSKISGNLASEQLNSTYDAFLGVLASFLGSHMQSRSSSELLLTTQMAVKACRNLLTVVEIIISHQPEHADALSEAKDEMYDRITELVSAAKRVFRPLHSSEDDVIYLPSEGMELVNAATACVSGAGRCISKARTMLEDTGDFDLDLFATEMRTQSPSRSQSHPQSQSTKPQLEIVTTEAASAENSTATSGHTPFWTPLAEPATTVPSSPTSASSSSSSASSSTPSPTITTPQPATLIHQPYLRDVVHSIGSESTLISSARDSGPSFISDTSTRATSPERSKPADSEEIDGEEQILEQTFAHELLFNSEGRVIGGTLNAIVERLTAHDSAPDNFFVSTVYLTFRLFATPIEFAKALIHRFEYVEQAPRIANPVRLRVYNVFKGWLEAHWRDECDSPALPIITEFAQNLKALPSAGQKLLELLNTLSENHAPSASRVLSSIGKTSTATAVEDGQLPQPLLSKTQLSALKSWRSGSGGVNIVDFDPLEVARQITIKESNLFCSILPEELLSTEFTKQTSSLAVNVRAMAQLSTDLANLVADSILQLEEPKKRAAIIKHWIKIANRCLELHNYDTLMAIVCSINSSTILRLKKTWDIINQKTKTLFEELKKVVDVSKNYSTLRQRVASRTPPCLPFVGMYLTDLTFVDHGNPATRQLKSGETTISVINLDKHMKTAKIISDLQRFQIPYRLTEVSELQTWLQNELVRVRAAGERNFQNHYRRSLVLEPREMAQTRPTLGTFTSMTAINKDKFDFLAWTHIGRDKTASVHS